VLLLLLVAVVVLAELFVVLVVLTVVVTTVLLPMMSLSALFTSKSCLLAAARTVSALASVVFLVRQVETTPVAVSWLLRQAAKVALQPDRLWPLLVWMALAANNRVSFLYKNV